MENNLEQSEVDFVMDKPDEVPAEPTQDSKNLGKFTSVEALAKAYEELQAAFTKKSQELANIKASASVAKENTVNECPQIVPVAPVVQTAVPIVISGSSGGLAFNNVSEVKDLRSTTKVVENFFKEKKL